MSDFTIFSGSSGRPRRTVLLALGVAAVTMLVFAPAVRNGFVDWDDGILLARNPRYRGLGWAELSWMFSNTMLGHYVPLTWLTFGLDHAVWGLAPAGYHATNVLLHAANAALVYLLALRLLAAATRLTAPALHLAAATSALVFALHPLRVESVAWVTERRDVLSGFFFLLTLLGYLRACEVEGAARVRRHAGALVCYLLALLAKSMAMTLPAILVLLDVYPLRRLHGGTWRAPAPWREKLPYAALAVLAAAVAYRAQLANALINPGELVPWSARPLIVAHGLGFYVAKTLLPLDLSPMYELPPVIAPGDPRFLGPVLAVVALGGLLVALARRWPAGLAVALAYAVLLAPVSGLVHSGHQLAHDRYSYLPSLPWALLAGAAAGSVRDAHARGAFRPAFGAALGVALAGWLATLALLTWMQIGVWRDTETLWRHALVVEPACALCENQLGAELGNRGALGPAIAHFERALVLRPDPGIRANLALALAKAGRVDDAIPHWRAVLARRPHDAGVATRLARALLARGRPAEAVAALEPVVRAAPDAALPRALLADAYRAAGRAGEAAREVEELRRRNAGPAARPGDPVTPPPR